VTGSKQVRGRGSSCGRVKLPRGKGLRGFRRQSAKSGKRDTSGRIKHKDIISSSEGAQANAAVVRESAMGRYLYLHPMVPSEVLDPVLGPLDQTNCHLRLDHCLGSGTSFHRALWQI